ncbi:MAG: hypothetical protein ACTSXH_13155 [Promethearchaeota archaeon]
MESRGSLSYSVGIPVKRISCDSFMKRQGRFPAPFPSQRNLHSFPRILEEIFKKLRNDLPVVLNS